MYNKGPNDMTNSVIIPWLRAWAHDPNRGPLEIGGDTMAQLALMVFGVEDLEAPVDPETILPEIPRSYGEIEDPSEFVKMHGSDSNPMIKRFELALGEDRFRNDCVVTLADPTGQSTVTEERIPIHFPLSASFHPSGVRVVELCEILEATARQLRGRTSTKSPELARADHAERDHRETSELLAERESYWAHREETICQWLGVKVVGGLDLRGESDREVCAVEDDPENPRDPVLTLNPTTRLTFDPPWQEAASEAIQPTRLEVALGLLGDVRAALGQIPLHRQDLDEASEILQELIEEEDDAQARDDLIAERTASEALAEESLGCVDPALVETVAQGIVEGMGRIELMRRDVTEDGC